MPFSFHGHWNMQIGQFITCACVLLPCLLTRCAPGVENANEMEREKQSGKWNGWQNSLGWKTSFFFRSSIHNWLKLYLSQRSLLLNVRFHEIFMKHWNWDISKTEDISHENANSQDKIAPSGSDNGLNGLFCILKIKKRKIMTTNNHKIFNK